MNTKFRSAILSCGLVVFSAACSSGQASSAGTESAVGAQREANASAPKRIELWENRDATLYRRWSFDGGVTWQGSVFIPLSGAFRSGCIEPAPSELNVIGAPALISYFGSVVVVVRTASGLIWNRFFDFPPSISALGWCGIFGTEGGHVTANSQDEYAFLPDSSPGIANVAGEPEIFMNAQNLRTGEGALLRTHKWPFQDAFTYYWTPLEAGDVAGSPTAVSMSPGRVDVFTRDRNGAPLQAWSPDDTYWYGFYGFGGILTGSPAITSSDPGALNVFGRGTDGQPYQLSYTNASGWHGWDNLTGLVQDGGSLSAVSLASQTVELFVPGTDGNLYQKSFRASQATSPWMNRGPVSRLFGAAVADPLPPPPCVSTGNPCAADQCSGTATDNCGATWNCHADCSINGMCPEAGGTCRAGWCSCNQVPNCLVTCP